MISLIENGANDYTIKLEKSFDFESHKEFRSHMKNVTESDPKKIAIDFNDVEYIDSSALGMLMLAKHEAEKLGCALELINVKDGHAKNVLSLVKFDQMFTIRHA